VAGGIERQRGSASYKLRFDLHGSHWSRATAGLGGVTQGVEIYRHKWNGRNVLPV